MASELCASHLEPIDNEKKESDQNQQGELRPSTRLKQRRTYTYSDQDSDDGRRGTKYAVIDDERRIQFVSEITRSACTIKSAAKKYGINFSTAKAIMQTYRREGRIGKKQKRDTKKKKILRTRVSTKKAIRKVSPQRKPISENQSVESNSPTDKMVKQAFEAQPQQVVSSVPVKLEEEQKRDISTPSNNLAGPRPIYQMYQLPMQLPNQMVPPAMQYLMTPQQAEMGYQLYLRQVYELHQLRQQAVLQQFAQQYPFRY